MSATATTSTVTATPVTANARPASGAARTVTRTHPLRRATVVSGVAAAVATTAIAAVADAAGVSFEIDGEAIPLLGFAQLTLVGAVLGGLIAAVLRRVSADPRRWFVPTTVALTAASCVPSMAWPDDLATRIVLVATHVVAALVVVPAIARETRR
jgi:hypothetical protein